MTSSDLLMLGFFVSMILLAGVWLAPNELEQVKNDGWTCTRWENKPHGDCTQWTRNSK